MKKTTLVLTALVWLMTGLTGISYGVSSYATSFKSTYPSSPLSALSTQSGQAGNLCTVCHGASGGSRNAFGSAYSSNGHNFANVQNLDSDNDGFTNLAEITAGTFPGNASSKPATTPAACTGYTYSAWSACGSNGQQTRTVTANTPAGCTGTPSTAAVLSQACTPPPPTTVDGAALYNANCQGCHGSAASFGGRTAQQITTALNSVADMSGMGLNSTQIAAIATALTGTTPPPAACTGYTYSAWSACGSNGQQTRTMTAKTPAGCTGTPSVAQVLTQACTPPPTTTACTGYTYSAWSACGSNGQQTRTMTAKTPAGCTGTPSAAQVLTQACTPPPTTTTCNYTYSSWSQCRNNTQTRRVTSTSPRRCEGTPVLTQTCGSTPPSSGTDGTTLYMQRCSACHGSLERSQVRGESASSIKSAISEVRTMRHLRNLTSGQIKAIATALVTTTPPPAPPVPSEGIHPSDWRDDHPSFVDRNGTSSCTTCHGQNLQGGTGPSCYSCHDQND